MSAWCHFRTRAAQQKSALFDQLVGAYHERQRHLEAKRLAGLAIDSGFKFRGLNNWNLDGPRPLGTFQRRPGEGPCARCVADFLLVAADLGRSLVLLVRGAMQSCNLGSLFLDRGNEIGAGADTHH